MKEAIIDYEEMPTGGTIGYHWTELVRCKDCNKRGTRDCLIEVLCPGWIPDDKWFCADGEKED